MIPIKLALWLLHVQYNWLDAHSWGRKITQVSSQTSQGPVWDHSLKKQVGPSAEAGRPVPPTSGNHAQGGSGRWREGVTGQFGCRRQCYFQLQHRDHNKQLSQRWLSSPEGDWSPADTETHWDSEVLWSVGRGTVMQDFWGENQITWWKSRYGNRWKQDPQSY